MGYAFEDPACELPESEQLAIAVMQAQLRDEWLTKPEQQAKDATLRFELIERISTLTDEQAHNALHYLSGYNPRSVLQAIEFATAVVRSERKRKRREGK
jgi:hypothetical protein